MTILGRCSSISIDISVFVGVAPDSALFKSSIYLSEVYTLEVI
jgi:hypothetical protein